MNSLNNCICLRISNSNWFSLHSIIFFDHFLEVFANELTTSVIGYLSWPRVSCKPFLLSYVSYSHGSFVIKLVDLKPTSSWINHCNTFTNECLSSFPSDLIGTY